MIRSAAFILVLLMAVNGLYWDATNLGKPLRPRWQPTLHAFFAVEQPGDFYTILPGWVKLSFAANARHPPKSRYTPLATTIPATAHRVWFLGWMAPVVQDYLYHRGWRLAMLKQQGGAELWRAEK